MIELASPYIHYYNRGVNKADIIFGKQQYDYLIQTFYRFLVGYQLELIAYCLMPNHYHIVLKHEEALEGSKFIQRVFNSFTQAVNRQFDRVGTLFQGSVKKRFIEDEEYLATTIMYIHLNPVKSRFCNRPEDWIYSDYAEWIGLKKSIRNVVSERELLFGSAYDYSELIKMEIESLRP
jgi:putative transposase